MDEIKLRALYDNSKQVDGFIRSVDKVMAERQNRVSRVKLLRIGERSLVELLNYWKNLPSCFVKFDECDKFPSDVTVLSVNANFGCRTIEFLIYHESFDVVTDGDIPPTIPDLPDLQAVEIKDAEMETIQNLRRELNETYSRIMTLEQESTEQSPHDLFHPMKCKVNPDRTYTALEDSVPVSGRVRSIAEREIVDGVDMVIANNPDQILNQVFGKDDSDSD